MLDGLRTRGLGTRCLRTPEGLEGACGKLRLLKRKEENAVAWLKEYSTVRTAHLWRVVKDGGQMLSFLHCCLTSRQSSHIPPHRPLVPYLGPYLWRRKSKSRNMQRASVSTRSVSRIADKSKASFLPLRSVPVADRSLHSKRVTSVANEKMSKRHIASSAASSLASPSPEPAAGPGDVKKDDVSGPMLEPSVANTFWVGTREAYVGTLQRLNALRL